MTFKSPTQLGCLISAARLRLGRVIFGGPKQFGALVATTQLRIELVNSEARLRLGPVIWPLDSDLDA